MRAFGLHELRASSTNLIVNVILYIIRIIDAIIPTTFGLRRGLEFNILQTLKPKPQSLGPKA